MTNLANPADQLTDVRDMVVVHKAFRREFSLLPQLIRAVAAGDVRRARRVAEHARLVLQGLQLHHTGEDELLWPLLLERAAPSTQLVHRMEEQHHRVERCLEAIPALVDRWAQEPTKTAADELAGTIEELRVALVEHLDDEEVHILPVAARHVSPAEWAALGEHGVARMSPRQLPIFFGMILEDATDEEQAMMLASVPGPVRLFTRTAGAMIYRRYVASVRAVSPAGPAR
ncbi:hemerythrin domain-containing protein [Microlunatus ginsengisoli]|uniref:Hemerythrin-like domain-containing protein n=1 Tax=Microlunatus ginsengisoli TaxID=363863 RepID=A0ABP6ZM83_9ACTN